MSLTSDLLSMTHEQFSTAYGGPDSLTEFLRMKAVAEAGANKISSDAVFPTSDILVVTANAPSRELVPRSAWAINSFQMMTGNVSEDSVASLALNHSGSGSTGFSAYSEAASAIGVYSSMEGASAIAGFFSSSGASGVGLRVGASHATGTIMTLVNPAAQTLSLTSGATAARAQVFADVSGIISVSTLNYVNSIEEFLIGNTTSGAIGDWGWVGVSLSIAYYGSLANHPGIIRMTSSGTALASLFAGYAATGGPDAFNGLTLEFCFRLDSITSVAAFVGIGYVNTWESANGGYRGLHYDVALSPNWRVLHRSNVAGGTSTYVDTGIAAVAGDWVHVKMVFTSGNTAVTVKTTSSPSGVTVSGTASYANTSGNIAIEHLLKSSSGNKIIDVDAVALYGAVTRL